MSVLSVLIAIVAVCLGIPLLYCFVTMVIDIIKKKKQAHKEALCLEKGHIWDAYFCSRCGECQHVWDVCICERCKITRHHYINDDSISIKVCSKCGEHGDTIYPIYKGNILKRGNTCPACDGLCADPATMSQLSGCGGANACSFCGGIGFMQ